MEFYVSMKKNEDLVYVLIYVRNDLNTKQCLFSIPPLIFLTRGGKNIFYISLYTLSIYIACISGRMWLIGNKE